MNSASSIPYILGVDLGGTEIKYAAMEPDGQAREVWREPFDPDVPKDWALRIRASLEELKRRRGGQVPLSIGLSCPGLEDETGQFIRYMPGRLKGLEGFSWSDWLMPGRKVPVMNDARAALLGESWLGAGKGASNLVLITLGTGVGGAAMVDGNLIRGRTGRAGHLGHICLDLDGARDICGSPGSLEWQIGNATLGERCGKHYPNTHALVEAARGGDPRAQRVWHRSLWALACAISSLVNVLDPEWVLLGGGIAKAGADLLEPLESYLEEVEWRPGGLRVRLGLTALGEYSGAVGAAHQGYRAQGGTGSGD